MPPSIKRQTPPVSKQPTFAAGSILSTAKPVNTLREDKVKVCLYGRNRSGKTTLAAQFPKPILFVSSEPASNGGALSIADIEGAPLIRVARCPRPDAPKNAVCGSAKVVAIANELYANNPFATVVLDTVTSLQDIVLTELLDLPSVPEMLTWGTVPDGVYQMRAEKLRESIRPLLELQNCNIVMLAQEADHNKQEDRSGKRKLMGTMQQESFMAPALGATNAKWLQDACGYVFQIYEDEITETVSIPSVTGGATMQVVQGTGKRQRHLRMLYHPNFAAGGRWAFDPSIPEFVTAPTPKQLYSAMAKYIPALKV